jgi:UDP-glucose 4-epimerase
MRVLVTGAAGHVGGAIAAHLVGLGWQVIGLDYNRPPGVAGLTAQIQADISATVFVDTVAAAIEPCAAIVHAAALIGKGLYEPAITLTNCLGTQQVLKLAELWACQRFVYTSSVPVIGTPRHLPITEAHPVDPPTAYHASKLYGEYLVDLASREGLAGASLRLTSPVGPGMPGNRILLVFVRRALAGEPLQLAGQGTRQQNYVDVRDVAQAVTRCLDGEAVRGVFNIAGKTSISNHALAQTCLDVLASSSVIEWTGQPDPSDDVVWDVSIEKAAHAFGYDPQYSVEDSIRAVRDDYASGDHQ